MSGCICAICYEDVLPASEHLQSVSICGHVFHELCLQQWIEYCPNGSTPTCPLCKQNCAARNAYRLYFQRSDSIISSSQKPSSGSAKTSEDYEAQVRKLGAKVQLLTDACKFANAQVAQHIGKETEHLELQRTLEADLMKMKKEKFELIEALGRSREELKRKIDDRRELLESNRAMSNVIAANRLVDVDLTEDDMLKLSGMNVGANKDAVIDILKKSLVLRNMAFKELMGKCRDLGMSESRALAKSQKLMQQVKRLRSREQDAAKVQENQENAALRSLAGVTTVRRSSAPPRNSPDPCHVNGLGNKASLSNAEPAEVVLKSKESDWRLQTSVPVVPTPDKHDFSNESYQDKINLVGNIEDLTQTQSSDGDLNMNGSSREASRQCDSSLVITPNSPGGCSLARHEISQKIGRTSDEAIVVECWQSGRSTFVGAVNRQWSDLSDEEAQHEGEVGRSEGMESKVTDGLEGNIDNMQFMLPIRREKGLGQDSVEGANKRFAVSGDSNAEGSKFIVSGANGRGDRITVLKPPRPFTGGKSSVSQSKKAKRLSHIAGCGRTSALKIEHFFGR